MLWSAVSPHSPHELHRPHWPFQRGFALPRRAGHLHLDALHPFEGIEQTQLKRAQLLRLCAGVLITGVEVGMVALGRLGGRSGVGRLVRCLQLWSVAGWTNRFPPMKNDARLLQLYELRRPCRDRTVPCSARYFDCHLRTVATCA